MAQSALSATGKQETLLSPRCKARQVSSFTLGTHSLSAKKEQCLQLTKSRSLFIAGSVTEPNLTNKKRNYIWNNFEVCSFEEISIDLNVVFLFFHASKHFVNPLNTVDFYSFRTLRSVVRSKKCNTQMSWKSSGRIVHVKTWRICQERHSIIIGSVENIRRTQRTMEVLIKHNRSHLLPFYSYLYKSGSTYGMTYYE